MLHSFVLDATGHLRTCCRLQELGLQGLQRGCLLQREGRREEQFGCGCSGGRARRGCPIREEELGCTAQTVASDFRTDLLICAHFGRGLWGSWLVGQVLVTVLDCFKKQVDKFTPLTSFGKYQTVLELFVGH